jgi:hypothetical protein
MLSARFREWCWWRFEFLWSYGFLIGELHLKSSGMWHPVSYKHYSQAVDAGIIDFACRENWTPVGKTFSEKASGIPESEFVIREADMKLFAWEAVRNLLAIITYQKKKRTFQPNAGRGMVGFFVAIRAQKKKNKLLSCWMDLIDLECHININNVWLCVTAYVFST